MASVERWYLWLLRDVRGAGLHGLLTLRVTSENWNKRSCDLLTAFEVVYFRTLFLRNVRLRDGSGWPANPSIEVLSRGNFGFG